MNKEPIDWDIMFALMECYGMLAKPFPVFKPARKRKKQRSLRLSTVPDGPTEEK